MGLAVQKFTGPARISDLVKWQTNPEFNHEGFTVLAGDGAARTLAFGALLALSLTVATVEAVAAADAGNTGNGTLTLEDPAVTASVVPGVYTAVCTTGGTDGTSKFRIEKPDGSHLGTATGGAAFNKHLKFTIAGGGTDFVEGDKFTVTVTTDYGAPNGKVVAWDPDATDGTEVIWGVNLREVTAPDGEDADGGLALVRGDAILFGGKIAWPEGVTDAQKEAAVQQLLEKRMLVR